MSVKAVRNFISNAKLDKALEVAAKLPKVIEDEDRKNTVLMLSAQYKKNEKDNRIGLINGDDYTRNRTKVNYALLSLLDELEDEAENPGSEPPITPLEEPDVPSEGDGITKILFLASNPSDTAKLQLSTEYQRISTRLQEAIEPEKFPLRFKRAVTPSSFAEYLFLEKPDIVHFSGHGDRESPEFQRLIGESRAGRKEPVKISPEKAEAGIFLMDEDLRHAHFVTTSFLKHTFENTVKRSKIPVKVVIFNACHSAEQAEAVSKIVPYVIGTSWSVKDNAATAFATGFYFGIGQNMNIEDAFNYGIGQALAYNEPEDRFLLYKDGKKVEW